MPEHSSWRDLLRVIINNVAEREWIAQQMGVHPMTLVRCAQGTSVPRSSNLRQLLQVLSPDARTQFSALLGQGFPDLASLSLQAPVAELDPRFLMEVHKTRETTPERFHFYGICHLIFQHALRLLDPERIGMAITVVKCMPPSADGKIRSLRENMSQATFPWERNVQEHPVFLGAESLAGYVVTRCRPQDVQNLATDTASRMTDEGSVMGCPLLYANRIAGCLLFFCLQPEYFLSQTQRSLVEDLTRLTSLVFQPEEFYPPEAVELFVMPSPALQQRLLVSFRQRVIQLMKEASQTGSLLTITQSEELIWQQLEAELIELSRQQFSPETPEEKRKALL